MAEATTLRASGRAAEETVCAASLAGTISGQTVECSRGAFGSNLESVVLTGSLARNEATVVRSATGCRIIGDADFLLVFSGHAPSDFDLAAVAAEAESKLRDQGIEVRVGIGAVDRKYFRALPAHSYTYELKNCGHAVWGDASVLDLIPNYPAGKLSKEDAWRTLCHRMIETVIAARQVTSTLGPLPHDMHYAALKLCLDMATSYLIFVGAYAPTYAERSHRLSELARTGGQEQGEPVPLADFASLISRCTAWKLQPTSTNDQEGWNLLDDAIWYACRLWRWEAAQLAVADGNCSVGTLIQAVAARQSWTVRLRGWASMLRRVERFKVGDGIRWTKLVRRVTPRYLVYWVAVELFFRLPCLLRHHGHPPGLDVMWSELRRLLPAVPGPNSDPEWQDIAADVMWNYERFLIGTNA